MIHILWILFNCLSWVSWIMPLKCALKHKWCFISLKCGVLNRVICKSVNAFCPQHRIMPTCNTLTQFTKIKCVHTHKIEKIATGKWDGYIFPNQLHCILLHLFKHCVHFIDILKFYWLFYLSLQCISLFLDIHVIKLHFLALFMFLPLFRMNGTFNEINSKKKKSISKLQLYVIHCNILYFVRLKCNPPLLRWSFQFSSFFPQR